MWLALKVFQGLQLDQALLEKIVYIYTCKVDWRIKGNVRGVRTWERIGLTEQRGLKTLFLYKQGT